MPSPAQMQFLSRRGVTFDDSQIYVASGTSAANYLSSPGGEAGLNSSFGIAWFGRMTSVPTAAQMLMHKSQGDASPYSGWELYASASGDLIFYMVNGGNGFIASRVRKLLSTDVGHLLLIVGQYEFSASRAALYVDRGLANPGTFSTIATYTVPTRAQDVGTMYGGQPATSFQPAEWMTWRGALTEAQLQSQLYDVLRTTRRLPTSLAAATVTHRWSLRDELAKTGTPTAGQSLPASIADTTTGVTNDAASRVGALTVAFVDPTTPRLFGYDASPILYGPNLFTNSSYYESADVNGIMPGASTGFFTYILAKLESQSVASGTRFLLGQDSGGSPGHFMSTSGVNSTLSFKVGSASGTATSPSATLAATDVGRLMLFLGCLDAAGKARLFLRRAEQGTGSIALAAAYAPHVGRTYVGSRAASQPSDSWSIYGVGYGVGVPTLAQVQALHDACVSAETIQAIAGMTTVLIDFSAGIKANANALPASHVDSVGGATLNRVGAPGLGAHYARAWGW